MTEENLGIVRAAEEEKTPPGKKKCPLCGLLNGVRTLKCGCGHEFQIKRKAEAVPGTPGGEGASRRFVTPGGVEATLTAVADFCGRYENFALLADRVAAVQSLRGRLTAGEHAEIERLAEATGGLDVLVLIAREYTARRGV